MPQSGRIEFISEGSHSYHIYLYSVNNSDNYIADIFVPYNSSLGKAYDKEYDYLVAGTYYFKIDGYANENYTVRTFFTSANESFSESLDVNNNAVGNANPVSLDTTYNGMLGENDEIDFYSFTVLSGTQTINVSANESVYFSVYSTTGEKIAGTFAAYRKASTGTANWSESVSLNAGTYCLKISKYSYSCFYSFSINSIHRHSYNYSYTVKPTTSSNGYDVYSCSCGAKYTTNVKSPKPLGAVKIKSVKSQSKSTKSRGFGIQNQVRAGIKFIIQETKISKNLRQKRP